VICALLFFCTTINYIDRNSLSVLKTTLQGCARLDRRRLRLDHVRFTFAYAAFPSLIGVFVDRFGVKKALAGALCCGRCAARPWPRRDRARIRDRAFRARHRRGGQLPRRAIKAVGNVVSPEGAGARHRHLQLGHQCGVHGLFPHGVDPATWGWQAPSYLSASSAGVLVFWQKYFRHPGAAGAARQWPSSTTSTPGCLGRQAVKVPWTRCCGIARSGLHHRKFITDPVWWFFPVLAAVVSRARARHEPLSSALLDRRHLHGVFSRLDSRRLVVRVADQARLARRQGAHDHDVAAAIFMPGSITAYYADSFVTASRSSRSPPPATRPWSANCSPMRPTCSRQGGRFGGRARRHRGGIGGMFMTLLAGLAVQWTGNQQSSFVGRRHAPHGAAAVLVLVQGPLMPVNVDAGLDESSPHRNLVRRRHAVPRSVAALSTWVYSNWQMMVAPSRPRAPRRPRWWPSASSSSPALLYAARRSAADLQRETNDGRS
jgi:ACS family hexuronate transporter-like MFS transporter